MNKLVKIELHTYDMKVWKNELVKKCVLDHPEKSLVDIAKLLGISRNTFQYYAYRVGLRKYLPYGEKNKISNIPEWELEKIPKFKK